MFIPTGENFKLTQWPFLNYFVYLVGSNQVMIKLLHPRRLIHQNRYRKNSLVDVVLLEPGNC